MAIEILYNINRSAKVTLGLTKRDSQGDFLPVRCDLELGVQHQAGAQIAVWNERDQAGNLASSGRYKLTGLHHNFLPRKIGWPISNSRYQTGHRAHTSFFPPVSMFQMGRDLIVCVSFAEGGNGLRAWSVADPRVCTGKFGIGDDRAVLNRVTTDDEYVYCATGGTIASGTKFLAAVLRLSVDVEGGSEPWNLDRVVGGLTPWSTGTVFESLFGRLYIGAAVDNSLNLAFASFVYNGIVALKKTSILLVCRRSPDPSAGTGYPLSEINIVRTGNGPNAGATLFKLLNIPVQWQINVEPMARDANDNIWIICRDGSGIGSILRLYDGASFETGTPVLLTEQIFPNFDAAAIACHPTNPDFIAVANNHPSSKQVIVIKRDGTIRTKSDGVTPLVIGRLGGPNSASSVDILFDWDIKNGTAFLCVQADGAIWVGEPLHRRTSKFDSDGEPLRDQWVEYSPNCYNNDVVVNNPTRLIASNIEKVIDFSKVIPGSGRNDYWTSSYNWNWNLPPELLLFGGGTLSVIEMIGDEVATANRNGRTYAIMRASSGFERLAELVPATGARLCASDFSFRYASQIGTQFTNQGRFLPNGDLIYVAQGGAGVDNAVVGIRALLGFDSNNDPIFAEAVNIFSWPFGNKPFPEFSVIGTLPSITPDRRYLTLFDPDKGPPGLHGMTIDLQTGKRSALFAPPGLSGDLKGLMQTRQFDSGIQFMGNLCVGADDWVLLGTQGELALSSFFPSATQLGQFNIYRAKDGLFVGQTGLDLRYTPTFLLFFSTERFGFQERIDPIEFGLGNALSPRMVAIGTAPNRRYFITCNSESGPGIWFAELQGLNDVQDISVEFDYSAFSLNSDGLQDFPANSASAQILFGIENLNTPASGGFPAVTATAKTVTVTAVLPNSLTGATCAPVVVAVPSNQLASGNLQLQNIPPGASGKPHEVLIRAVDGVGAIRESTVIVTIGYNAVTIPSNVAFYDGTGMSVGGWTDNRNDFDFVSDGTGAIQLITDATGTGNPGLRTNGTDNRLLHTGNIVFSASNFTAQVTLSFYNLPRNGAFLSIGGGPSLNLGVGSDGTNALDSSGTFLALLKEQVAHVSTNQQVANDQIYVVTITGSSDNQLRYYVNGGLIALTSTVVDFNGNVALGSVAADLNRLFPATFIELAFWSTSLTPFELQTAGLQSLKRLNLI